MPLFSLKVINDWNELQLVNANSIATCLKLGSIMTTIRYCISDSVTYMMHVLIKPLCVNKITGEPMGSPLGSPFTVFIILQPWAIEFLNHLP